LKVYLRLDVFSGNQKVRIEIDAKKRARRRVAKMLGREYLGRARALGCFLSDGKIRLKFPGRSWQYNGRDFYLALGTLEVRQMSIGSSFKS
jgi:hypothetical protein